MEVAARLRGSAPPAPCGGARGPVGPLALWARRPARAPSFRETSGATAVCSAPSAPPGGASAPRPGGRRPCPRPPGFAPPPGGVAPPLPRGRSGGLGLSPPGLARRPAPRAPPRPVPWPACGRAAPGAGPRWGVGLGLLRASLAGRPARLCGLPRPLPGPRGAPLRSAPCGALAGPSGGRPSGPPGLLPPGGAGGPAGRLFRPAPPGVLGLTRAGCPGLAGTGCRACGTGRSAPG